MRILADSNCIIDFANRRLPPKAMSEISNAQVELSVINRIELLSGTGHSQSHSETIQSIIDSCLIHSLTEEIILTTISIRKERRRKLPDAIIAATALVHNLPLYTRNMRDFSGIPGLSVINPHDL